MRLLSFLLLCQLSYLAAQGGLGGGGGCVDRNGRWPDPNQCDAYVQCEDGVPSNQLCPDGLVFSPDKQHAGFPCVYPTETDCSARSGLQPAQPNGDCPHQFGLFRLGDANNCGQFLSCSHGRSYIFDCPEGLAFNEEILRCDWPDLVSTCSAEGYLSFTCPVNQSPAYGEPGGYPYFRAPNFCEKYFICINGRPRLFICGKGQAFDTQTNTCQAAENVTGCYTGSPDSRPQQLINRPFNSFTPTNSFNYYRRK